MYRAITLLWFSLLLTGCEFVGGRAGMVLVLVLAPVALFAGILYALRGPVRARSAIYPDGDDNLRGRGDGEG